MVSTSFRCINSKKSDVCKTSSIITNCDNPLFGLCISTLYMPSFAPPSERISYIISSSRELTEKLNLKNFEMKFIPLIDSSQDFQQYLLGNRFFFFIETFRNLFRIADMVVELSSSERINRYSNNFFGSFRMLYSIPCSIEYHNLMFANICIIFQSINFSITVN